MDHLVILRSSLGAFSIGISIKFLNLFLECLKALSAEIFLEILHWKIEGNLQGLNSIYTHKSSTNRLISQLQSEQKHNKKLN